VLSNEPKMNIVRCPQAPQRALKNAKWPFSNKNHISLEEVRYKVSLHENCQRQSCKTFIGLTIHAEMIGGGRPLLCENLADSGPLHCKTLIFISIFTCSASAVTPSKKSSVNTNRKSTKRFPMRLR